MQPCLLIHDDAKLRNPQDLLAHRSQAATERYLRLAIVVLKEAGYTVGKVRWYLTTYDNYGVQQRAGRLAR